jgi:DNA-binding GntR family transcriptional regulator
VSLVDNTEQALRSWLVHGGHRAGDRLPPELELASMIGVSRGTLRVALERLEESGEIVRRQGSGTFVARVESSTPFDEGLETLVTYHELAQRRGVTLAVRELSITRGPLGAERAQVFDVEPAVEVTTVARVVLADGEPAALMADVVHPEIALPPADQLRAAIERGDMVLDVLLALGVPVGSARTRVTPRLIDGRDAAGRAFGVGRATAVLELEEVMYLTSGEPVQWSSDVFAPGGIDLHVRRALEASAPAPVRLAT